MKDEKKIVISGDNIEISDGNHSFDELYKHRSLLWINLCLLNSDKCYVVEDHYTGWFLLVFDHVIGQISYHCPNCYLHLVKKIASIDKCDHIFDGHTSFDVLDRLQKIASEY